MTCAVKKPDLCCCHASQMKVVVRSGGVFVRKQGCSLMGCDYEGGETRLVSIPAECSHATLERELERAAGTGAPVQRFVSALQLLPARSLHRFLPCGLREEVHEHVLCDHPCWLMLLIGAAGWCCWLVLLVGLL